MKSKMISKKTPDKRTRTTNFLYILNEPLQPILCFKCGEPIEDKSYCFLCQDLNKIWHYDCMQNDHTKLTKKNVGDVQQHCDWCCLLKILDKETFDAFNLPEMDLKL